MSSVSTLTTKTNETPTNSNNNQVPSNLIPVSKKAITFEYAKETKDWAYSFDFHFFHQIFVKNGETELINAWQKHLIKMQEELQSIGYDYACKEIVRLFKDGHKVRDPKTKQLPVSYEDVLKIIEQSTWYREDIEKSRNLCWAIMYGLTRRIGDRWLVEAARTWKAAKNIVEFRTTKLRKGIGFVQKNMIAKACTVIQRRVKVIMWHSHKEELSCKRKYEKERINLCEIKINCFGYDTYLYIPSDRHHAVLQIRQSVKHALQVKIEYNYIVETVKQSIEEFDIDKTVDTQNGKLVYIRYLFYSKCIIIFSIE